MTSDKTTPGLTPTVTIDGVRHEMAIAAALKILAIAGPLQRLTCVSANAEVETAHELAIRVEELSGAIVAALDEDTVNLDEERYRVLGPEMNRLAVREARHG